MLCYRSLFVLITAFLVQTVTARGITNAEGATCLYIANNSTKFPFDCKGDDLAYKCRCRCPAFLGSVLMCIESHSNDSSTLTKAYNYVLDVCENQALVKYKFSDLVEQNRNASDYRIDHEAATNMSVIHNPIVFDEEMYDITFKSVTSLMEQRALATKYGIVLLSYWGLVFVIALIVNIARWCFPYYFCKLCNMNLVKWVRRHFICSQLIKPVQNHRSSPLKFRKAIYNLHSNLPIRLHAIIITTYIFLVTLLCCINYKQVKPNTVFRCSRGQTYVNIADRTGIIAIIQLPLSFLFASRNNPLLVITGTSYREFQLYHKWVSRIIFILIVLHTAFYLLYVDAKGDYISRWGLTKWRFANAAFAAITITTASAFVRKRFYEWFKMSHKLLIVAFVVGVWYHCITLGWIEYVVVSFSIWAGEYVFRVGKVIVSGGVLKAKCKVLFETIENGDQKLIDVPHAIRIEINHSGWWRAFPGAYCWIYFMKSDMFWQAHPFTIVSSTAEENFNQLVLIIRVKEGLTRRLANYIATKPNAETFVWLLVEGPYGSTIPFKAYDHSVFVAGGVGMTVVYTIALYLAQTYRAQILRGQKFKTEKSISIVWMTPNFESLFSFRQEIESIRRFEGLVELQIFITRGLTDPTLNRVYEDYFSGGAVGTSGGVMVESVKSVKDQVVVDEEKLSFDAQGTQKTEKIDFLLRLLQDEVLFVSLNVGERPDLGGELSNYIRCLHGTTAVIACGPPSLNADVRVATVECLKGDENVDYFEEELLW